MDNFRTNYICSWTYKAHESGHWVNLGMGSLPSSPHLVQPDTTGRLHYGLPALWSPASGLCWLPHGVGKDFFPPPTAISVGSGEFTFLRRCLAPKAGDF